jgi:hypothetical protein
MAHTLDLRVVAEGVETEAQRDILLTLQCDELQGFLFAKPMPALALAMWASDDRGDPAEGAIAFRVLAVRPDCARTLGLSTGAGQRHEPRPGTPSKFRVEGHSCPTSQWDDLELWPRRFLMNETSAQPVPSLHCFC